VGIAVEQVHRAAPPTGDAGFFTEELGHHRAGCDSSGDDVPMLTVVGVDIVVGRKGRHQPDDRRFLTQIQVTIAADLGFDVHLAGAFFEAPYAQHLMVVGAQGIGILMVKQGVLTGFDPGHTISFRQELVPVGLGVCYPPAQLSFASV
jgi:hypothetical protein